MTDRTLEAFGAVETVRTLDLIAWSLRLPLLWEQATRVDATPDEQAAERARLDALITEGERALGILPEEEAS